MKILLLPDSFKGSLSSLEVINIIQEELQKKYPSYEIVSFPFADGGEGTLECLEVIFSQYQSVHQKVTSSYLDEQIEAEYLIHENTVFIESAKVMGLAITNKLNPFLTTTYGIGSLLLDALDNGYRDFVITLGGSSTNDGGAGLLASLGMKFFHQGQEFIPTGGTLKDIDDYDISKLDSRLKECHFTLLSDVTNSLLGKKGATYTFAKQKGAKDSDLPILEEGMNHYASLLDIKKASLPSSGAAGGLAYAFLTFFPCQVVSGAKTLLQYYHLEERYRDVDLIITGEGKTDVSSFSGKCIAVVAEFARKNHIPVMLLSGYIEEEIKDRLIKELGFVKLISVQSDQNRPWDEIKAHAKEDLAQTVVKYLSC